MFDRGFGINSVPMARPSFTLSRNLGKLKAFKLLLDKGVDIGLSGCLLYGGTALLLAVIRGTKIW